MSSAMMIHRPAVVLPALDNVHLITAARAVETAGTTFSLKHQIRAGLPIKALRVAMAIRPDFRPRILLTNERIVGRHGAVIIEPQRFAGERIKLLRQRPIGGVPSRDVELAVWSEAYSAAGMKLGGRNPFD